jgi:hypothetical protein
MIIGDRLALTAKVWQRATLVGFQRMQLTELMDEQKSERRW